jgi:hypothetical protein
MCVRVCGGRGFSAVNETVTDSDVKSTVLRAVGKVQKPRRHCVFVLTDLQNLLSIEFSSSNFDMSERRGLITLTKSCSTTPESCRCCLYMLVGLLLVMPSSRASIHSASNSRV